MKLGIFFRGNIKEGMDCRYISSGNPGFAGTPTCSASSPTCSQPGKMVLK